jgi:hypothetical protein
MVIPHACSGQKACTRARRTTVSRLWIIIAAYRGLGPPVTLPAVKITDVSLATSSRVRNRIMKLCGRASRKAYKMDRTGPYC